MITKIEVHAKAQALWDATKKLPEHHVLRVRVEQAILSTHDNTPVAVNYILRYYDASDPTESWAWLGRLLPICDWFYDQRPMLNSHNLFNHILDNNILLALDATKETVEELCLR